MSPGGTMMAVPVSTITPNGLSVRLAVGTNKGMDGVRPVKTRLALSTRTVVVTPLTVGTLPIRSNDTVPTGMVNRTVGANPVSTRLAVPIMSDSPGATSNVLSVISAAPTEIAVVKPLTVGT